MKKLKSIGLTILMILMLVFVVYKLSNKAKPEESKLFPNSTINVGYMSVPPGFIVDPNTKEKSGIFNDVLVEIAKRNGLSINYKEEVAWATMIETLNANRVDLIANQVWATPERRANADFSKPIYFSPIGIFVRADDNRFDTDFSNINDPSVKIAALDGEINFYIAQSDFPKAELKPLPNNVDLAQLFMEVATKKKDVFFVDPMYAYNYTKNNPGQLKNIAINSPIRNYPNAYMYKKGNVKLGEFLNDEIEKLIKDGSLDSIINKYLPFKGALISVTDSLAIEKQ
ncbi:MAG: transporter substrate-binding domain-containing protein [Synergistaceae bacterium]|jgi:polar amino acid transport system substrate-binding protein|nr:transporter substrate-binding domain-containing protein [Synergistaceae bacterium]MDD2261226.1 transporter substrate-binding domain-containing protein [Clostridia bacterium]MDD3092648.1 transporter substrate-binding domain-containing protein [Clostridia bacterium]MDD3971223.1 transporter substrate-binding domain-containing protein [Clostridia bacterium]